MSLFVMGDTHLSLSVDKPMDVFPGWTNYVDRMKENWLAVVKEGDTVVIPGDISWGMSMEEANADFDFLQQLPGSKILLKGNHDYWWNTKTKMDRYLDENGFDSIRILFNNAYLVEGIGIAGTRGWFYEEGPSEGSVYLREVMRLERSLEAAKSLEPKEIIVFLHYPPIYQDYAYGEIMELLKEYDVHRCYYGHMHGGSIARAFQGEYEGVSFHLVSADAVQFAPVLIDTL